VIISFDFLLNFSFFKFSSDQPEGESQAFQHNLLEEITCGEDGDVSDDGDVSGEEDEEMVIEEASKYL